MYFILKPDLNYTLKFDIIGLNKHFSLYSNEFIVKNIVQFYKNTGLIAANGLLVFYPFYDIKNLENISSNFKNQIYINIKNINKNVHKDTNNTIINYTEKVDINSELILIINADFDIIK